MSNPGLAIQVRDLHNRVDKLNLTYRSLLFRHVVVRHIPHSAGRANLVEALSRLGSDGVILGMTVLDVLALWLDGNYDKSIYLDRYEQYMLDGVIWLITGDECHTYGIEHSILKAAKERALDIARSHLEYIWRQEEIRE